MRKILSSFVIAALAALAFSASPALAQECPSEKVATTIINFAGKVIETCVPEAAVPHIGGEGDVVIPATCPCFSQEDVQAAFDADPSLTCISTGGTTSETGEACTLAQCFNSVFFTAVEGPLDFKTHGGCQFGPLGTTENNSCSDSDSAFMSLTEAEADACVAILQTFE